MRVTRKCDAGHIWSAGQGLRTAEVGHKPTYANACIGVHACTHMSSGMNDVHSTRQVCRPAEKTAGNKATRQKLPSVSSYSPYLKPDHPLFDWLSNCAISATL